VIKGRWRRSPGEASELMVQRADDMLPALPRRGWTFTANLAKDPTTLGAYGGRCCALIALEQLDRPKPSEMAPRWEIQSARA